MRSFGGRQVLVVTRRIEVAAASRAAAGRLLKREMDVLLDNDRFLEEFLTVSGFNDGQERVSFDPGWVRDWHLDTGTALAPTDGNGPRAQRVAELLVELEGRAS